MQFQVLKNLLFNEFEALQHVEELLVELVGIDMSHDSRAISCCVKSMNEKSADEDICNIC